MTDVKRVQSTPAAEETLLTSLAWPFAARLVQPTGKVVADQIRQLFKLLLMQVVKTTTACGEGRTSATGPAPATLAVAGAAGARITEEEETSAALRRAKRATALNMVKDDS